MSVLVTTLLGRAYRRRVEAEERMLEQNLPSYRDYGSRTSRLIPWVW